MGRNYVVALERQVAQYESLLRKAKAAPEEERGKLLDSISFEDHLPSFHQSSNNIDVGIETQGSSRMATMSLQPSAQGNHARQQCFVAHLTRLMTLFRITPVSRAY